MSVDASLDQDYDRIRNNCLHFAARAWHSATGDDRLLNIKENDWRTFKRAMQTYNRVEGPTVKPSIVLMEDSAGELHMGVCKHRRFWHISENGPQYLPFDLFTGIYKNIRFFL